MFCVFSCLFMAFISVTLDPHDWLFWAASWVLAGLATWVFVVRPRLVMLEDEIVLVGVLATTRYPLRDVMSARPSGYGTYFSLTDGEVFCASTLSRPNYAAWLRLRTRAHRAATEILVRAAQLRGDPIPAPVEQPRELGEIEIPWWSN